MQTQIFELMQESHQKNRSIEPLTKTFPTLTNVTAYEVAWRVHAQKLGKGQQITGRKIGFTNKEMWHVYGVKEPIWSHMYDSTTVYAKNGVCALTHFSEPKIEPELVLHLQKTPSDSMSEEELLTCIDWVAPAFEIVQSHFPNWQFQAADAIADSALHAKLFVGEKHYLKHTSSELEALKDFSVALFKGTNLVDKGSGTSVLGSPLLALKHLVSVLAQQPKELSLCADELISTGTLTAAFDVQAGEQWQADFAGLFTQSIKVSFEK